MYATEAKHKVFEEISKQTNLPLISIVEATRKYVISERYSKLILLGTQFTMSSSFYQDSFLESGIELITPNLIEQKYIQTKLFTEIELGILKPGTQQGFIKIIDRLETENNTQGVILACTELPMIIKPEDIKKVYIDPTAIHIREIVKHCTR